MQIFRNTLGQWTVFICKKLIRQVRFVYIALSPKKESCPYIYFFYYKPPILKPGGVGYLLLVII